VDGNTLRRVPFHLFSLVPLLSDSCLPMYGLQNDVSSSDVFELLHDERLENSVNVVLKGTSCSWTQHFNYNSTKVSNMGVSLVLLHRRVSRHFTRSAF